MAAVPRLLAPLLSSTFCPPPAVLPTPSEFNAAVNLHRRFRAPGHRFRCSAGQTGFFTRLGRLIKEKAKSDVEKIFSGFSKTRENLAVIDELLLYWNLADTDRVLDELEEALLVSDFGPKISMKIVDSLRDDILAGKLKSGNEIKEALKRNVLNILRGKNGKTDLQLGFRKPAVIMIVGVNGGGKTTSLGKLAWRLKSEGVKVLMAAGDTFRAAASEQLEVWAERTGSEIVVAEGDKVKASLVLSQAVKKGKDQGYDIVLCDTSGRLHTNYSLMEELVSCKKSVAKVIPGAPNEILLVLDGTTGLNMLPQAREFNEVNLLPPMHLRSGLGLRISCSSSYPLPPDRNRHPEAAVENHGKSVDVRVRGWRTPYHGPAKWASELWQRSAVSTLPVVGVTGLILTKLDGSARGGCVVSVVDELGIPVKFIGVGEGVDDLQPFEAEAFVNAIFA